MTDITLELNAPTPVVEKAVGHRTMTDYFS